MSKSPLLLFVQKEKHQQQRFFLSTLEITFTETILCEAKRKREIEGWVVLLTSPRTNRQK